MFYCLIETILTFENTFVFEDDTRFIFVFEDPESHIRFLLKSLILFIIRLYGLNHKILSST